MPSRHLIAFCAALLLPGFATAQITWQFNYADGSIAPGGYGFADPAIPTGEALSYGQLRRNSLSAAATYLNSVVDGRGNVELDVAVSINTVGDSTLGYFGPRKFMTVSNTFQAGGLYQAGRTNQLPTAGVAGAGGFNFTAADTPWNYFGQQSPNSATAFDLTTVAIHELVHGLGFLSLTTSTGSSRLSGATNIYSAFDQFLQAGTGSLAGGRMFDTTRGSSTYGSFLGPASTLTSGTSFINNPNPVTTNLYFGGPLTREANGGGPVGIYAPNPHESGSSTSHVIDPNAVMSPVADYNQVRRLQPFEKAMLYDLGWNQFHWNGSTSGTWLAGANNVAQSNWRTDQGIVYDGSQVYNDYNGTTGNGSNAPRAPVMPPAATGSGDLLLHFSGANYTSTNDLGTVRAARLNLTTSGPVTLAGNTLAFGVNTDGTNTVLAPQVVQSGAGAVTLTLPVQVSAGDNLAQPRSLAVIGSGAGELTLAGGVSGNGGLQKDGPFTLTLQGSTSFTGPTQVLSGPVRLTGSGGLATSPTITVGLATGSTANLNVTGVSGGFALAAGQTLRGAGAVTGNIAIGAGILQGGNVNAASGTLSVTGNVTATTGSTVRAAVGAAATNTSVAVSGTFTRISTTNPFTISLQPDAGLVSPGTPTVGPWTVLTFASSDLPLGVYTAASANAPFTVTLADGTPLIDWSATVGLTGVTINSFTPVPEPATVLLVATGTLWGLRRRRG